MGINKNWNRWIFVSTGLFFKPHFAALTPAIRYHIEGQLTSEEGDYVELRMSGPEWDNRVGNQWRGEIVVNFLVKCVKDEKDYHKIYRMTGAVEAAIAKCFFIKKYGDTVDDNKTVTLGEMQLFLKGQNLIETVHYGQLVNDVPSIQSTVEAHYRTDLTAG